MPIVIALDGPSGSGKSSVSKLLAKRFNLIHIDSGAMYRAVTLFCLENNIDCKNETAVVNALKDINVSFSDNGDVLLNKEDVESKIRSKKVTSLVSYVSSYKEVRLKMIHIQREIGKTKSIIMDGRDIGTFVFPNADVKIYQIASAETRAKRRLIQNERNGINTTYNEVLDNIKKRDYIDSHREFDPSSMAEDAICIDTTKLTISQVVEECSKIIDSKLKENKKL